MGSTAQPPAPIPYNKDFEDLTLRMLRQAAERQKLEKQLREEAAAAATDTTNATPNATTTTTNGSASNGPSSEPSAGAETTAPAPPPATTTKGLFGGVGGQPVVAVGSQPVGSVPAANGSSAGGGLSLEGDILARMRMMSKVKDNAPS